MTRTQAIRVGGGRERDRGDFRTTATLVSLVTGCLTGIAIFASTAGPKPSEWTVHEAQTSLPPTPVPVLIPPPLLDIGLPKENPFIIALKAQVNTPGTILKNWIDQFEGKVRVLDCSAQENRAPFSVNYYPGLTGRVDTIDNVGINVRTTPEGLKVGGLTEGGRYYWPAEADTYTAGELATYAVSPIPVTNEPVTATYLRRVQNETLFAERRRVGSKGNDHESIKVSGAPKQCKTIYRK